MIGALVLLTRTSEMAFSNAAFASLVAMSVFAAKVFSSCGRDTLQQARMSSVLR